MLRPDEWWGWGGIEPPEGKRARSYRACARISYSFHRAHAPAYVYLCVCVCVYTYVCVCVYVCVSARCRGHVHTRARVYMRRHELLCVCVCICATDLYRGSVRDTRLGYIPQYAYGRTSVRSCWRAIPFAVAPCRRRSRFTSRATDRRTRYASVFGLPSRKKR